MPVKEKEEVLTKDIKEDLNNIRMAVIAAENVSELSTYNLRKLSQMYKNPQQQITFMRKIYSESIQEVLSFMSRDCLVEAMINLCVLEAIFDSQQGCIDIETGLDCIEAINQYIYKITRNDGSSTKENFLSRFICSGIDAWNNLKAKRAIRVCITPFLDYSQNLTSIEQELDAISETLRD